MNENKPQEQEYVKCTCNNDLEYENCTKNCGHGKEPEKQEQVDTSLEEKHFANNLFMRNANIWDQSEGDWLMTKDVFIGLINDLKTKHLEDIKNAFDAGGKMEYVPVSARHFILL